MHIQHVGGHGAGRRGSRGDRGGRGWYCGRRAHRTREATRGVARGGVRVGVGDGRVPTEQQRGGASMSEATHASPPPPWAGNMCYTSHLSLLPLLSLLAPSPPSRRQSILHIVPLTLPPSSPP